MDYFELNTFVIAIFDCNFQEYYQSDRPTPAHYRHSQSDLTEWDEPNNSTRESQQRRSGGHPDRDAHYQYRNGSREKEEWDENERGRPR